MLSHVAVNSKYWRSGTCYSTATCITMLIQENILNTSLHSANWNGWTGLILMHESLLRDVVEAFGREVVWWSNNQKEASTRSDDMRSEAGDRSRQRERLWFACHLNAWLIDWFWRYCYFWSTAFLTLLKLFTTANLLKSEFSRLGWMDGTVAFQLYL